MRVVFYEVAQDWERSHLEARLPTQRIAFVAEPLTEETAMVAAEAAADVVSVFIHSRVDAAVLERLPTVRLIATRSTGWDHVDADACAGRGIAVANVPHYGENTVAEHTFGLMLNLARHIHRAIDRTRGCDFSLTGLEGTDLRDKVLGVVGGGNIGLHVIRIARAVGMKVLCHDVQPQPILAEVLGFRYVPFPALLADADIVSLHVPLNDATRHMLDRDAFGRMKRGALLVNTARGAVVDTDALVWALDEGIVAGAALDVLEGEERLAEEQHLFRTARSEEQLRGLICGHALLDREDVLVTPHMAWYSREARQRILDTTATNVQSFVEGRPANLVVEGER